MPFDVWTLHSQPAYWGKRSKAELRARTLLGALEGLRHGITTIQDMNSLVPQDEETLDTILSAYAEVGIRVVFSIAVRDLAALDIEPFLPADMPADGRGDHHRQAGRCQRRPRLHPGADHAPQSAATAPALGDQSVRPAALLDAIARGTRGACRIATSCRCSPTSTRRARSSPKARSDYGKFGGSWCATWRTSVC